jgi:ferritin-like metal-binding protein YciE
LVAGLIQIILKIKDMAQDKKTGADEATEKSTAGASTSKASQDGKQSGGANSEGQESLLEKFFYSELKDVYSAEQQIMKALPKMEAAATTEELKEAFNDHLHVTTKQAKRLEKIFKMLGQDAGSEKCEAMEGIIKEAEKIMKDTKEGSMTRDAALIIAAQKVEHYEIATYGGLVQLAVTLQLDEVAELLDKTLGEEEETDLLLTDVAESYINMEAEEEENFPMNRKSRAGEEAEAEV